MLGNQEEQACVSDIHALVCILFVTLQEIRSMGSKSVPATD